MAGHRECPSSLRIYALIDDDMSLEKGRICEREAEKCKPLNRMSGAGRQNWCQYFRPRERAFC